MRVCVCKGVPRCGWCRINSFFVWVDWSGFGVLGFVSFIYVTWHTFVIVGSPGLYSGWVVCCCGFFVYGWGVLFEVLVWVCFVLFVVYIRLLFGSFLPLGLACLACILLGWGFVWLLFFIFLSYLWGVWTVCVALVSYCCRGFAPQNILINQTYETIWGSCKDKVSRSRERLFKWVIEMINIRRCFCSVSIFIWGLETAMIHLDSVIISSY